MTFLNFSYQYPPEAKVYLELSRTSAMELFREIFFFQNFTRIHLCWSLFLIKLQAFYTATLGKERTPIQVFSDTFLTENLQVTVSVPRKNILPIKKYRTLWEKKKWKQHVRKTKALKTKTWLLFISSLHIVLLLKNFFISLFSVSYDILKAQLDYYRKVFLTFCLKNIVFI